MSRWLALLGAIALPAAAAAADGRARTLQEAEERGRRAIEEVPEAPADTVLLAGGTVMTAAGAVHAPGWVVLEDGRIREVGAGEPPSLEGALVVDVAGRFVTPGLIDTHSHLGVYPSPWARAHRDGNEATAPTTAGVWAEHSFWPQDPGLERAVAGGVTTLQVLPGSANLVGGRGVVLHAAPARGSRAMRFPGAPETVKMACGENPKRVYGERHGAPSTRMGNVRGHREAFLEAQQYLARWETFEEESAPEGRPRRVQAKLDADPDYEPTAWDRFVWGKDVFEEAGETGDPPERDLDLETLAGVLSGEILPQVHCYRADDMLSMLQLADEFGFRIRSFHHALDAYKIRDVLAREGVASSTWADWWGFKLEAWDGIQENAALLTEAGARAVIHSDSAIGIQRLNQEAAKAYHKGLAAGVALDEDAALRWITANPAWALGIEEQVGTLEPGKRADVVVWSAHPFSVYSRADLVYVDGHLRWDATQPQVWSDFVIGTEVQP